MAPDRPPQRLKHDVSTSEQLRSMLEQAHGVLPSATQLTSLADRIDVAIAAGIPAATATSGGILGGKAIAAAATVVAGTLVVVGIWLGSRGNVPVTTAAVPTISNPPQREVASFALPTPPSTAASALARDDESAESAVNNATPHVRSRATTGPIASAATPPNEAALLHEARSKLLADPARALQLTAEHARRFPNGALVQEREVIAIEALRRLGQTDAARLRGAAFERRFPQSAHRSKVEQSLKGGMP